MFTKRSRPSICLVLFMLLVSNINLPFVLANDSFRQKSEILRDELTRYRSCPLPNERYQAALRINAALLEVLRERASLNATQREILGEVGWFDLAFSHWAAIGDNRYRLVVLSPPKVDMGAIITVYVQAQAGGVQAEQVHILTQGANIGQLAYYDIVVSGGEGFVMLMEKRYGPEDKYVSVYMLKLDNGRWQIHNRPPNISSSGRWTVRSSDRSFSLSHQEMGWKSANDYVVRPVPGKVEIMIVDQAGRLVDSASVRFTDGEWAFNEKDG